MNTSESNSSNENPGILGWLFSWKGLRAVLILFAALFTIWGLFCALENYRGQRAWTQTQAELTAKGEKLTVKELLSPVPENENLANIPLFKPLLDWTTESPRRPRDSNAFARVTRIALPAGVSSSWGKGEKLDLEKWAEEFRGQTNYPLTTNLNNKAEEILYALDNYKTELDQIVAAAKLPHARFQIRYEDGADALLPHLSSMISLSKMLVLRANARLKVNKSEPALEDVLAALRLGDAASSDPLIIGVLVHISIDSITVHPIWEGIQDHRWTGDQLRKIQDAYRANDYHRICRDSFRMERAMMVNHTMEGFVRNPANISKLGSGENNPMAGGGFDRLFSLTPRGWIRQNQATINRLYQRMLDEVPEDFRELHRMDMETFAKTIEEELHSGFVPYVALARMLFPAISRVYSKTLRAHAVAAVVQAGCALERHRLLHGRYPETLAALDRTTYTAPLLDPYTGTELKYIVRPDATRAIYSVGPNRKDDGGTIESRKNDSRNATSETGDVVFTLPAQ